MKDLLHLLLPPRHWTDQMLRVHAFSCVLAVRSVSLLHRRVAKRESRLRSPV